MSDTSIDNEITAIGGTLTKDEPVIVSTAAAWVVGEAGEFIVGHTHLVTAHEWTATQSTLIPIVTTVLTAIFAWSVRRLVTPAAKAAGAVLGTVVSSIPDVDVDMAKVIADTAPTVSTALGELASASSNASAATTVYSGSVADIPSPPVVQPTVDTDLPHVGT